jgi:hypothetical protein
MHQFRFQSILIPILGLESESIGTDWNRNRNRSELTGIGIGASLTPTQVNDVRRETAGSRRFPVNSGDHIQNWFLCQFPASFPPIPALGNGDRIRLPFPGRFRNAGPIVFYGAKIRSVSCRLRSPDPIGFYGAKIWSVSCRLRNPDLTTKHNLGISISCFDFGSSHADPRGYKPVPWFISISDGF